MEGDVDSDSDDEIEYSGMIQPPLIKQLRTILSEYPDDGQILKEIIQNAEDAGASEMKIMYDGRRTVQQESTKKAPFRKYFRGPALLVYNNAVFSEDDWKGIKMLYNSIKELDRTKVGRFGLGFKSVFHITDHPLIISGKQLLVIDPHQDLSKVCQTMQLRKLHKYKKMKVDDCLEAFQGVFGFEQSTLDNGHFNGTIFRFPLREDETELSDNIYDESKVDDLFMSFKGEAPVSLLFLKCLESIVLLREEESTLETSDLGKFYFSVKIDESTIETVRSARTDMSAKIQSLDNSLPCTSILNKYDVSVCVTNDAHVSTTKHWKVMNLFKGESNMPSHLKKLSCDPSLSYSPYVGVALDMDCPLELQGHVFCFLPLPLTEKSLSGLPLHINGCFALSQNRRVVKWPTSDQIRNHAHTDKSIQWNQALAEEVLSELYSTFILELVEESQRQGRLEEYAPIVSRCIPNMNFVDEHWKCLMPPMVEKMRNMPVYFTPNEGGKWILQNQAVFLRPNAIMQRDEGIELTIRKVLDLYHQNTVEVEDYVWNTMELKGSQEVNADFMSMILRRSEEYTSCSDYDKINLIRYLLGSGSVNNLEGLDLLLLQNGSYINFSRDRTSGIIYMASPEETDVLLGMEDVLLQALPSDVEDMLSDIIKKGIYQIQHLREPDFIDLLKRTIHKNIGDGPYPVQWKISGSDLDFRWLERLWKFLVDKFPNKLDHVSHLPLIPEMVESDVYQMHMLDANLIQGHLSINICMCLKLLSINVLGTLPDFVQNHSQSHRFIPDTSLVNIINAIDTVGQMHGWKEKVEHFNQNATEEMKTAFLQFLSRNHQELRKYSIQVLKNLAIFRTQTGCISITQNQKILPQKLPVSYPSNVILTTDADVICFAKQLGGFELDETEIFIEILQSTVDQRFYTENEMQTLMEFIIENKIYNRNSELLQLVRRVPFVLTDTNVYAKPSQLFDPHDDIVCKIVLNRSMFPSKNVQEKRIKVLRKLGLKSNEMLTAAEIYQAAIDIHQNSIEDHVTAADRERQAAIMNVLCSRNTLFDEYVPNKRAKLRSLLMGLEIIYPLQNPISPIPNLPWFKSEHFYCKPSDVYHSKYEGLVGYVAPVTPSNISSTLVEEFGLNRVPNIELVLQQHSKYAEKYAEDYKSEFLLPIKRMYEYLAMLYVSDRNIDIHLELMWMGDGFVEPNQICIHKSPEDIELRPYLIPLPKDFQTQEMKHLADHLGCKQNQTRETLIAILNSLKEKHEKGHLRTDCILQDIDITIRILNKLKSVPEISTLNILIPIHSSDKTRLEFRPAKECNYCNAEWLKDLAEEEGEPMCFVHEDIASDTAAKLGVPSLTENLLSETEGIQEWGQTEPLTRRIKNLIIDYKDGFAVPKEIVQNADDAKATKVCFLYDERENMDCRTKLIDEQMESCQGPALWAYNNALFSDTDLENITKLSGATKEEDLSKVGKFGLGFCSVYNLTDVPSFITGSNMVIFDPHARYLGKAVKKSNPGIKIDLTAAKNKTLLRRMKNQFIPFNNVFGCNLEVENPSFQGTLFRFPLRTKEQACHSEISEKHYNELEMKSMIHLFVKNAGNLLLFTQHVKEIEFYHLKKNCNATEKVLLYRLVRNEDPHVKSCKTDVLSTLASSVMEFRNGFKGEIQQVLHTSVVTISRELTSDCHTFCRSKEGISQTKWLISWASGTKESLEMMKSSNIGALPLAATALFLKEESGALECKSLKSVPEGFYSESHIFCYLPLPVSTELPVHINGSFAVSSNRRQLSSKTTDDKNYFENRWNEALLADAVTNAYTYMIESLDSLNIKCANYFELWPSTSAKKKVSPVDALYIAFYRNIINDDRKVLCREQKWVSLSKSIFLDLKFLMSGIEKFVEDATIKYMEKNGATLIKLEKLAFESFQSVYGSLPKEIEKRIVSVEVFYKDIFLQNINDPYWDDSILSIVLYALDNPDKRIRSLMQETQCIPTRPNGALKKPSELVKSTGSLAKLFCEEDERFPRVEFETPARLEVLKSMGMMVCKVGEDVLMERIYSIKSIANKCAKCSIQRCKSILKYTMLNKIKTEKCQNVGENVAFLPVLSKPTDWILPWFLEDRESIIFKQKCEKHETESISFALAKPSELYHGQCKNLVGCQKLLLDVSLLQLAFHEEHILTSFGVCSKAHIETDTVVCQLIQISNCVNPSLLSEDEKQSLKKICSDIYEFLDKACQAEKISDIITLQNQPCLLIDDVFVRPKKVALSIQIVCSPALYGLDRIPWKFKSHFLRTIGVKKEFEIEDILFALQDMSEKIPGKLDQISLELACNLVELLAKTLKVKPQGGVLAQLKIPNEDGCFSPIHELCLNDSTLMKKGQHLKYPNPNIKEADARILGVQSKVRGSLQDYVGKLQPFGQKEELTNRITRILTQYPQSESILKEMLQNADDASATEVMFIADLNEYGTKQTFDESWHPLQGPALLVYNNSYFTENDIAGIQHLGRGSKSDDPTKTGQYGVGFNAVYHITDVPSFISKAPNEEDTFCVMDPHCRYVPGATEYSPGARFSDLNDLREPFADVFKCYHEDKLLDTSGTVFRLPLRTQIFAETSNLSQKVVTKEALENMLDLFTTEMAECLLFLKSVRQISIASIKDGKLEVRHTSQLTMSDEDKKRKAEFDKYVIEKVSSFRENRELYISNEKEVVYEVTLKDTSNTEKNWLLYQRFGFNVGTDIPKLIQEAFEDQTLGLLPQGGIAMPIGHSVFVAKAFCFLPMPCTTGLTMHINGQFSLDNDSRRGLWKDDKMEYRTQWNYLILSDIIAPLYAKAIERQLTAMELVPSTKYKDWQLRKHFKDFRSFFPHLEKAADHYWKHLTMEVYKSISKLDLKVFLRGHVVDKDNCELECHQLSENNSSKSPVIFNIKHAEDRTITALSKDLGMCLVDTPDWIWKCLDQSDLKTCQLSPSSMIGFLKSSYCALNCQNEMKLDSTSLKMLDNLLSCIKFCKKFKDFETEIDGLPLCLLENGVLIQFSQISPVISTSYYELLPSSFNKMLHHGLHTMFANDRNSCIVSLSIDFFAENLALDLNYETYRHKTVQWKPNDSGIPNKIWIENVWRFFHHILQDVKDREEMLKMIHPVLPWSLIPTKQTCSVKLVGKYEDTTQILFPIEDALHVIDLESFQPDLKAVLQKLNLPLLESLYLPSQHPLRQLIASRNRLSDVLECLYFHKQSISENDALLTDDCHKILEYFAGDLDTLLSSTGRQRCIDMLRALPIYATVYGVKINLLQNRNILVLPEKIPPDGMNVWAEKSQIVLLRHNDRLNRMFKLFKVTEQSLYDLYSIHIFPTFQNIPKEDRIIHLTFIKDELLKTSGEYTNEQEQLIRGLKALKFVPNLNGKTESASEFFDPQNDIMKEMLHHEKFPPEPFSSQSWNTFMTLAGMISVIDSTLFIEFAKKLEEAGRSGVSFEIREKSKLLVEHLLHNENLHDESCLRNIGKIKFVYPYGVQDFYCNIASPLKDNKNALVAYDGSVSSTFEVVAWTKHSIIAETMLVGNKHELLFHLGLQEPNIETVIEHMKTVCQALSINSETELHSLGVENLSAMMVKFYEFLNDRLESPQLEKLRRIPFVFVARIPKLFPCDRFTLSLKKAHKLAPYAMPLPDVYCRYFTLFETLGTSKEESYKTYADILERIFIEANDDLHANETQVANTAMEMFFSLIPSDAGVKTVDINVNKLYLLSCDNKLEESCKLIYPDSATLENVIKKTGKQFNLMASFGNMDRKSVSEKLLKLPNGIRPLLLSEVILMDCNLQELREVDNDLSSTVTIFLTSPEFINGILRIVCKERANAKQECPNEEEVFKMHQRLKSINIKIVENLETVYVYKDRVIYRELLFSYPIFNEDNHCTLYFRKYKQTTDVSEWFQYRAYHITEIIQRCIDCQLLYTSVLIPILSKCIRNPNEIEVLLNENDIPRLDTKCIATSSKLPTPGALVEEKWYSILDNRCLTFEKDDYVAVLIGVDSRGNREFVYAVIKDTIQFSNDTDHTSDMYREYFVQVAPNKRQKIKAFDLYRFNRSLQSEKNTHSFPRPLVDNRSLADILKEVEKTLKRAWSQNLLEEERNSICRRLMLQWHPDKNPDDVKRSTKVFQFLSQTIQALKDEEDRSLNESIPRSPPNDIFDDIEKVIDRDKAIPKKPLDKDSRPSEGNRWLEQAKHDVVFASQAMVCGSHFNWICYVCHQAAEKALKGWQYYDDARKVLTSEYLYDIILYCPEDLKRPAKELQDITSSTRRMRYPENRHKPCDAYTRENAEKAIELASLIVDRVDELI